MDQGCQMVYSFLPNTNGVYATNNICRLLSPEWNMTPYSCAIGLDFFSCTTCQESPKLTETMGGLTALDQEVLVGQANECQSMLSPYAAATNTDQASHMRWPGRPIETVCLANTPVSGASAVVNTASAHRLHRSR